MTEASDGRQDGLVFLLDVDNTLLDHDRLKADLADRLQDMLGPDRAEAFWRVYEDVRKASDYVDYPTTVKEWIRAFNDPATGEQLQALIDGIDFQSYVYPHVFETLGHLRDLGKAVILSDGDQVFQPLKIRNSGIEAAVDGVLIFVHKELELSTVFETFPAGHYVMIDDKPRILAALERECPTTFTTVFVLQGKYAVPDQFKPGPDIVVERIGDVRTLTRDQFLAGAGQPAAG
jgi:FMN phosphatase YigB (HAD superfamily)